MTKNETQSAKDQVLAWVRSKNPQTMELKFGCRILVHRQRGDEEMIYKGDQEMLQKNIDELRTDGCDCCSDSFDMGQCEILGSDMGLQELLIALKGVPLNLGMYKTGRLRISNNSCFYGSGNETFVFELTKNLHNQSQEFYEEIAKLIPASR